MELPKFNYMLVVGNSGTGKTTYVKRIALALKEQGFKVFAFDPNRLWADVLDAEVGPEELGSALTTIAKPLVFERRNGLLVIEDLGFALVQIAAALRTSQGKAKNMIRVALENARKYGLKVVVVAHRLSGDEVDLQTLGMFDAYAFFTTTLTPHWAKAVSRIVPASEVQSLPKFRYVLNNGGSLTRGEVEPLESHASLEADKDFAIKRLLAQCESQSQKILVLKTHLGMGNTRIAEVLGTSQHYVEVTVSRWRHRAVPIPDGRAVNVTNLIF